MINVALEYVGPVLEIVLDGIGDPALAAVVAAIIAEAQKDLAVASALITDFGPTPTAATAFASVATNLAGLLTAGHITNVTSVAAVNKAVSEVGVIASAVQLAANALKAA